MRTRRFIPLIPVIASLLLLFAGCSTLRPFYMEEGRRSIGPFLIGIAYKETVRYFGYIKPGLKPDAMVKGKNYFYLYVWIDVVAPEIGIRMLSPVGSVKNLNPDIDRIKNGTDFVSPDWEDGLRDKKNYFDTYITFERALDIIVPDQITPERVAKSIWVTYTSNDDSREMPRNPGRLYYNSLLRYQVISDPLKPLIRGLYRIGFTSFKVGDVQGTFYAEVGAPIKLSNTYIARDIAGLQQLMKK